MSSLKKRRSRKKKILFHSCHSRQLSGFGKNCKNVLRYLCSTGDYEIIEVANAYSLSDKSLKNLPWKCIGSGPDSQKEIRENNENEITAREMSYGLLKIDELIQKEKPDIYIGAEDIWAFIKTVNKPWWNKIPCMIWTTLDSLPMLPESLSMAGKIKHFFCWASFAEKAMHKEGFSHVKTLHGSIDTKNFFKLSEQQKENLRNQNDIEASAFIVGFVFRNQTRKSVPNLIKGFSDFIKNKEKKCYLLLHTGWHEGWDILNLAKEHGLDQNLILTTYFCKECKSYKVQKFQGQSCGCENCKSSQTLKTISVQNGPDETQLNEIYNMMDVYCHPFNSGGQEIPIQEAKLAELITLVTNYSCGEDMCVKEAASIPLDWTEFREPGTQFIKASTCPKSISKGLEEVFKMKVEKVKQMGKQARDFVIKNYSYEAIGGQLDSILKTIKTTEYNFDFEFNEINPDYNPPRITDDSAWIVDVYKNMFSKNLTKKSSILRGWADKLSEGKTRDEALSTLKNIAKKELSVAHSFEKHKKTITECNIDINQRIGVCCNKGKIETFFCTTALKNIQELHPNKKIFFITHPSNFTILNSSNFIYKKIPYFKQIEEKDHQLIEGGMFGLFYNFNDIQLDSTENKIDKSLVN